MTAVAGKSDAYETALLLHILNNVAIPLIGDASGVLPSAVAGSLYVSLHTADPTEEGNQASSEIGYTDYQRQAVARTAGGWTVTGNSAVNAATIEFPIGTGGSGTATFFGIGAESSGAGFLIYAGPIASPIVCGNNITPRLTTITVTED